MGHALGMTVVGEGIETARERDELTAVECDEGQGYLFAAPLSAEEIARLWSSRRPAARPLVVRDAVDAAP